MQPALRQPEVEHRPRHVQRGEQADDEADRQADAEALELIVADDVQHDGGEDARQVRVDDRREGAVVAVADGQGEAGAAFAFLAQTLVDQHVGIDGHAEHEHEAGQAGQREGGVDQHHEADRQQQVGQQRDAGDDAGEAVVDEHEDQHGHEGEADRQRALADRVAAERRPHGVLADRLGFSVAGRAPARRMLTSS